MIFLVIAILLFSAIHLIPVLPKTKSRLKDRFGTAYGPLFGLAATITFAGIVVAWSFTDFDPVFEPDKYSRYFNMVFSFLAFLFLGVFFFRGKLRQIVRFPFAIAVILWAIGHLLANGDLASIILFGGLLTFAVVFIAMGLANKVFPTLVIRDGHDTLSLIAGASVYIAMVQLHKIVIGVPVIRIEQFFGG